MVYSSCKRNLEVFTNTYLLLLQIKKLLVLQSFLQATDFVNEHDHDCFRFRQIKYTYAGYNSLFYLGQMVEYTHRN